MNTKIFTELTHKFLRAASQTYDTCICINNNYEIKCKKFVEKDRKKYRLRFLVSIMKMFFIAFLQTLFLASSLFGQSQFDIKLVRNDEKKLSFKHPRFPNAIYLSKEDIKGILLELNSDDPNGIVSLLALNAGLTFRNTGDAGAETWFIVRNFGRDNSRMTLVLLDGRPLNLANNHTVEFDDIPVNIIESITIYPGPVPAEYGGFQSVIDIKTKHNEDIFYGSANMGSQATYRSNVILGKAGRFHYLVNFNLDFSAGQSNQKLSGILKDFQYSNREVRTFIPTFKIGYEITKNLDITFQANFVDFKKMFSSKPMFGVEASRKRIMNNYAIMLQPGRSSKMDYQLIIFQNREIESLNPIFPEDTTYNVHWGNQNRTLSGFRGFYRHNFFDGKVSLKMGAEGHWAQGRTDDNYIFFKYMSKQNFIGGFVEADLSLWKGSYITIGGRIDRQNGINKTFISPVVSVSQAVLNNRLGFYASYGLKHRWIPLNEVNTFNRPPRIFGPPFLQGNVSLPKLSLSMELLRAFDAGITAKLWNGKLIGKINYFYLTNEGQYGTPILEIRPINPGAPVPPNIQAAIVAADRNFPGFDISQGLEIDLQAKPFEWWTILTNATYFIQSETRKYDNIVLYEGPMSGSNIQPILNQSIGQFVLPYHGKSIIPGAYKWLANMCFVFQPDNQTIINTIARYRGKTVDPIMKFGINPKTNHIPSSVIFDAFLARDILDSKPFSIRACVSVNNLFNKVYETFVYYPMQSRFYSIGFSATIK